MHVQKTKDGRNIYCSSLMDDNAVDNAFRWGLLTDGATIYRAKFGSYGYGSRRTRGLHVDVKNDSGGQAGIWVTGKDDIASVFRDLAGIEYKKYPRRLKNRRLEANYSRNGKFVGFSAPLKEDKAPAPKTENDNRS